MSNNRLKSAVPRPISASGKENYQNVKESINCRTPRKNSVTNTPVATKPHTPKGNTNGRKLTNIDGDANLNSQPQPTELPSHSFYPRKYNKFSDQPSLSDLLKDFKFLDETRKLQAQSRKTYTDLECQHVILKLSNRIHQLEVDLINTQEDCIQYQSEYLDIKEKGSQLYDVYMSTQNTLIDLKSKFEKTLQDSQATKNRVAQLEKVNNELTEESKRKTAQYEKNLADLKKEYQQLESKTVSSSSVQSNDKARSLEMEVEKLTGVITQQNTVIQELEQKLLSVENNAEKKQHRKRKSSEFADAVEVLGDGLSDDEDSSELFESLGNLDEFPEEFSMVADAFNFEDSHDIGFDDIDENGSVEDEEFDVQNKKRSSTTPNKTINKRKSSASNYSPAPGSPPVHLSSRSARRLSIEIQKSTEERNALKEENIELHQNISTLEYQINEFSLQNAQLHKVNGELEEVSMKFEEQVKILQNKLEEEKLKIQSLEKQTEKQGDYEKLSAKFNEERENYLKLTEKFTTISTEYNRLLVSYREQKKLILSSNNVEHQENVSEKLVMDEENKLQKIEKLQKITEEQKLKIQGIKNKLKNQKGEIQQMKQTNAELFIKLQKKQEEIEFIADEREIWNKKTSESEKQMEEIQERLATAEVTLVRSLSREKIYQDQIYQLEKELKENRTELSNLIDSLQLSKNEIAQLNKNNADIIDKLKTEQENKFSEQEKCLEDAKNKFNEESKKNEELLTRVEEEKNKLKQLQHVTEENEKKFSEIKTKLENQLKNQENKLTMATREFEAEKVQLSHQISEENNKNQEKTNKIKNQENKLEEFEKLNSDLNHKLKSEENLKNQIKMQLEKEESKLNEFTKRNRDLSEKITNLMEKSDEKTQELIELASKLDSEQKKFSEMKMKLENQLKTQENKLEVLQKDMESERMGFNKIVAEEKIKIEEKIKEIENLENKISEMKKSTEEFVEKWKKEETKGKQLEQRLENAEKSTKEKEEKAEKEMEALRVQFTVKLNEKISEIEKMEKNQKQTCEEKQNEMDAMEKHQKQYREEKENQIKQLETENKKANEKNQQSQNLIKLLEEKINYSQLQAAEQQKIIEKIQIFSEGIQKQKEMQAEEFNKLKCEFLNLQEKISNLQSELAEKNENIKNLKSQIALEIEKRTIQDNSLKNFEEKLKWENLNVEKLNKKLEKLKNNLENEKTNKKLYEFEKNREFEERKTMSDNLIAEKEKRCEELANIIDLEKVRAKQEKNELENLIHQLKTQLESENEKKEEIKNNLENKISQIKAKYQQSEQEKAEIQSKINHFMKIHEEKLVELKKLNESKHESENLSSTLNKNLENLQNQFDEKSQNIKELEINLLELNKQKNQLNEKLKEMQEKCSNKNTMIQNLNEQIKTLNSSALHTSNKTQELVENYENAIKKLTEESITAEMDKKYLSIQLEILIKFLEENQINE